MRNRWKQKGWLPALELIRWPRLERLRSRHEELVDAGDAKELGEHVRRCVAELLGNRDEVDDLVRQEKRRLRKPPGAPPLSETISEMEARQRRDTIREAERLKHPDIAKLKRDDDALATLYSHGLGAVSKGENVLAEVARALGEPVAVERDEVAELTGTRLLG